MRTLSEIAYDGKCCSAGVASAINKVRQRATLRNTGRHLTKGVLSFADLESRFYAVLSKAASKWPSVKATPDRSPGNRNGQVP
jgi:hypothetical protein